MLKVDKITIGFIDIFIKGAITLAEEEKNIQEQDQEEDTAYKVVMPEPNRVTMPAREVPEQPAYLVNFANFYVSSFERNDLEIISEFDSDHNMININHYLLKNQPFSRKDLVRHVLVDHANNFLAILNNMTEKTGVDPEAMSTYEDWSAWYEEQRSKIHSSLS